MREFNTAELFNRIFKNVNSSAKIRRVKRVVRNICNSNDSVKSTFSDLAGFMESQLFDLQTKKC